MGAREARIKSWAECEKSGYTECIAETRSTMIEFVKDNINRYMKVALLLASIENVTLSDYYAFDVTSYSNIPAKPIYTKQELTEVLI
jgi:hypothetical protein